MAKQRNSQFTWVTLLLCLCFGSLVILPTVNIAGLSTPAVSRGDIENHDQLEQPEFEEELFLLTTIRATIVELTSSKSRPMNLDCQTADLISVSPPPKAS
jgi:hypothetical protein